MPPDRIDAADLTVPFAALPAAADGGPGALAPTLGGTPLPDRDGLVAEFHPDGQLAHLAWYAGGRPQGWALRLDLAAGRGHVARTTYEDWAAAYEDPETGEREEGVPLAAWARQWIAKIEAGEGQRLEIVCSFCGKGQHEVRKIIAGPSVMICDECITLCNDILAEEV